ncbi:MAG TPA: hypothetical protein VK743_15940 [Steroidobacteraceae bacterium]|nr:hypothetical protein [Steroidobacteraceae bacterium]
MYDHKYLIAFGTLLALVLGPLWLGVGGFKASRRFAAVPDRTPTWDWRLAITSALLYALTFNLIFFIQELFLVLPKAFIPGLHPTLFHNNHRWEGENPLANLVQGTGALAIFVTGVTCAFLLKYRVGRSSSVRLFLIWMAYNGFLQSLPQVVIGSIEPENDVGMAMDYLHLGAPAKTVAALLALTAIPAVALWLRRPLLGVAGDSVLIANGRARTRFVFNVATLPALAAILLIIPFRVPRNWVEVAAVPVVVTLIGIGWIQAGAWAVDGVKASGVLKSNSMAYAFSVLLILLLVFQFILRPGIRFY